MHIWRKYWYNRWRPRSIYLIFLICDALWPWFDHPGSPRSIRHLLLRCLKRANRALARIDEAIERVPPRGFPTTAILSATFLCNLRCIQCWFTALPRETRNELYKNNMPIELFRKVVKELFPYLSTLNPGLSGEPFLLSYFDELIEACHRYEVKLDLITNGTLLNEERLKQIYPVLYGFRLSIEAASKEMLESIRVGTKYDVLMANLRRFQHYRKEQSGPRPIFGGFCTVMKRNLVELPALLELAVDLEMDYFEFDYMLCHNKQLLSELPIYHIDEVNTALDDLRRRAEHLPLRVQIPAPLPVVENGKKGPRDIPYAERQTCRFLWDLVAIDSFGIVRTCCEPRAPTLGNATKESIRDIWRSETANRIRSTHRQPDAVEGCRVCYFYRRQPSTLAELEETYIRLPDA